MREQDVARGAFRRMKDLFDKVLVDNDISVDVNDIDELDDILGDGGEARCEGIIDRGDDYIATHYKPNWKTGKGKFWKVRDDAILLLQEYVKNNKGD